MTNARLIVRENSGYWGLAWRTALMNSGVSVTEVAELANAFEHDHDDAQTMLAFEATEACAEEGFHRIQASRQRDPGRGVIVLLDEALATSATLWQEAGAIAVVRSPRHLAPIARLMRRYFETRTTPPTTFRQDVWQRMPWSESKLKS